MTYQIGQPVFYKGILMFVTSYSQGRIRLSEEIQGYDHIWVFPDDSNIEKINI